MNDTSIQDQKYQAWLNVVNRAHNKGWKCINQWVFMSPLGRMHDLSVLDFDMLDYISENGISLV